MHTVNYLALDTVDVDALAVALACLPDLLAAADAAAECGAIGDALDRIDAAERAAAARWDAIDALIGRGWTVVDAMAEIDGTDAAAMERAEQLSRINAERLPGESLAAATRRAYDAATEARYVTAENWTRGHMVNARGRRAGVKARSLFFGPASRVQAYASDELTEWFSINGRVTVADWREQTGTVARGRVARAEQPAAPVAPVAPVVPESPRTAVLRARLAAVNAAVAAERAAAVQPAATVQATEQPAATVATVDSEETMMTITEQPTIDAADAARIRVATEDNAAHYYGGAMRLSANDAARYVSEGHLSALCDRYTLGAVWAAVGDILTARPELLAMTAEQRTAAAEARDTAAREASTAAREAFNAEDYRGALETIDAAELLAPDAAPWAKIRAKIADKVAAVALMSRGTESGDAAAAALAEQRARVAADVAAEQPAAAAPIPAVIRYHARTSSHGSRGWDYQCRGQSDPRAGVCQWRADFETESEARAVLAEHITAVHNGAAADITVSGDPAPAGPAVTSRTKNAPIVRTGRPAEQPAPMTADELPPVAREARAAFLAGDASAALGMLNDAEESGAAPWTKRDRNRVLAAVMAPDAAAERDGLDVAAEREQPAAEQPAAELDAAAAERAAHLARLREQLAASVDVRTAAAEALAPVAPVAAAPTVHTFDSTGQAYDASQTRDDIRDGDVIHVPAERVAGFLLKAWPVALTTAHGHLHAIVWDHAETAADMETYAASVAAARALMTAHGYMSAEPGAADVQGAAADLTEQAAAAEQAERDDAAARLAEMYADELDAPADVAERAAAHAAAVAAEQAAEEAAAAERFAAVVAELDAADAAAELAAEQAAEEAAAIEQLAAVVAERDAADAAERAEAERAAHLAPVAASIVPAAPGLSADQQARLDAVMAAALREITGATAAPVQPATVAAPAAAVQPAAAVHTHHDDDAPARVFSVPRGRPLRGSTKALRSKMAAAVRAGELAGVTFSMCGDRGKPDTITVTATLTGPVVWEALDRYASAVLGAPVAGRPCEVPERLQVDAIDAYGAAE